MAKPGPVTKPMAFPGPPTPVRRSYLDFARIGQSRWWFYAAGFVTIIAFWLSLASYILIPFLIPAALAGKKIDSEHLFTPTWANNLAQLLTFIPLLLAVPLVVRWFHQRPWRTLITPFTRINWRLILLGMLIWGGLMIILGLATILTGIDSVTWSFTAATFIPNAAVCLVLLLFQTSAEEFLFRGYLPQWLALLTQRRWVQSIVIGIVFTIPHMWNPEVAHLDGVTYFVGICQYFVLGFALMWVAHTSGTIELGIGAHFINNVLASLVVTSADSVLGSASLFTAGDSNLWTSLGESIIQALAFILITMKVRGNGTPTVIAPPRVYPNYLALLPAGDARRAPVVSPPVRLPVPGWYRDPWMQASWRYWNGSRWTPFTAPPRPVESPQRN